MTGKFEAILSVSLESEDYASALREARGLAVELKRNAAREYVFVESVDEREEPGEEV